MHANAPALQADRKPTTSPRFNGQTQAELLNLKQSAALYGVSARTFHLLRDEPWLPKPIALGVSGRVLRWRRSELIAALANAPRQAERAEPIQLTAGRIARKTA